MKPLRIGTLLVVFVCLFLFFTGTVWAQKKLSLLTWNIPAYEQGIRGWIADFEKAHAGVKVEWLDKKGSVWAAFYQTQLAGGTAPDVVEIQGPLWVQYADMGALINLTPFLDKEAAVKAGFDQNMLNTALTYQDKNFMVPFFMAPTVLFYNKIMFKETGLTSPPETFEELVTYARKLTKEEKSGFLTLNFDWHYWPLFRTNGVKLLTPDNKKAAFNTSTGVKTVDTLRELTEEGVIAKISWTGRWKEPNDAFGAGTIGMFNVNGAGLHVFRAAGADWVSPDTIGVASFPGGWAVPNYHALGISSTCKYPELAWELVKVIVSAKWQEDAMRFLRVLSGNSEVNEKLLSQPSFRAADPLRIAMFEVELSNMDKLTGNPLISQDERVKDAFYRELQNALFGKKTPQQALEDAETIVNRILSE